MANEKKDRLLNFEMLRIVSMFLILTIHYNVPVNGSPTWSDIQDNTLCSLGIIQLKSITFVGANVFVMISGYFRIYWKWKSFLSFIYQLAFWAAFTYILTWICGRHEFSILVFGQRILNCCAANWFYLSYIGLYLFAPVLNAYIDSISNRQLAIFIGIFYTFAIIFGYITQQSPEFNKGCSFVCLIGLYLTGAFISKSKHKIFKFKASSYFVAFILLGWILGAISIVAIYFGSTKDVYGYLNPFILSECVLLFLGFSKLTFTQHRKVIMYFSSSVLAVLLLHYSPDTAGIYRECLKKITETGSYPFVFIPIFFIFIFVAATLIDKIRIKSWKILSSYLVHFHFYADLK